LAMPRFFVMPFVALAIGLIACGSDAATSAPVSTNGPEAEVASSNGSTAASSAGESPTPANEGTAQSDSMPGADPTESAAAMTDGSAMPGPAATEAMAEGASSQEPTAAPAMVKIDQPPLGNSVGDTLPKFEFTLADGRTVSTAQLSEQGKPVFLFFFATW